MEKTAQTSEKSSLGTSATRRAVLTGTIAHPAHENDNIVAEFRLANGATERFIIPNSSALYSVMKQDWRERPDDDNGR